MKIVGGRFRGRALKSPEDQHVRPTSGRVREALFNILLHGIEGFTLDGARVLDLFAGTGALGLEAISRGAAYCLFVEDDASARGVIRDNVETLGLTGATKIWRRDAANLGPCSPMAPFQLLFADPPYGKGLLEKALLAVSGGGWLAPGAVCVLEEAAGTNLSLPGAVSPRFQMLDSRNYGAAALHFLKWT
jgi:16S rRNA (guanine966-N2)-methyltransferase